MTITVGAHVGPGHEAVFPTNTADRGELTEAEDFSNQPGDPQVNIFVSIQCNSMPEDVNERVRDDWVDETTPFERVRTVLTRTYEPQSADEIAERALTTATTARKHLRQLAESGFVEVSTPPDREATCYRRSTESLVLEQAREILDGSSRDELVSQVAELQERIAAYRAATGADSPEDSVLQTADVEPATIREWQSTRRNLGFAKVALALSQADDAIDRTQVA